MSSSRFATAPLLSLHPAGITEEERFHGGPLSSRDVEPLSLRSPLRELLPASQREPRSQRFGEETERLTEALAGILAGVGIKQAFGVTGGAVASLCDALGKSSMRFIHCRHEGGAAFAAAEAYFASGQPSLVFTTTGPGLMNALTGVSAARWEGAKLVLVSGGTSAALRGRWACQETSSYTASLSGLFQSGPLFNYAVMMEHPAELDEVASRLMNGLSRPGGFVAHISVPTSLQGAQVPVSSRRRGIYVTPPACGVESIDEYARMLASGSFVIWVGFGARKAAATIRRLAELTGAPVMCSPRGKGIFPERHPQFLGVTGLGGHGRIEEHMAQHRPDYVLVLGTRLGEPTSYFQDDLVPSEAFIHVDVDPEVPGAAYPLARTYAVHAEVGAFVEGLMISWDVVTGAGSRSLENIATLFPAHTKRKETVLDSLPPESLLRLGRVVLKTMQSQPPPAAEHDPDGPVRPRTLMNAVQRIVVDGSNAIVMTESGNAFAWGNHLLRFDEPARYRVSVGYGSMGHFTAGVVGAALGREGKAVAIVGDGSMLMNNEINTAVQYCARAVWIVMNDARYGMVDQGMRAEGLTPPSMAIPEVDFTMVARGMGADGVRVQSEKTLDEALHQAMAAPGPFVVDVRIDPSEPGPWLKRIQNLIMQRTSGAPSAR